MLEKLLIFLRLKKRKPLTPEQRKFVKETTVDSLKELERLLCNYEKKHLSGYLLDARADALIKQLKKDGPTDDIETK